MCVFGNKCDLEEQREVDDDLANQFASSIGAQHFLTSALSSQGDDDYIGIICKLSGCSHVHN
jgi:hypothetical protein